MANIFGIFKTPIACISCGKKSAYRSHKLYVIAVEVIVIAGFILSLYMTKDGDFHPFTSRFVALEERILWCALIVLMLAFLPVGYYEFFVKKHTYRCEACGHEYAVTSKISLFPRIFILCMLAVLIATPLLIFFALRYINAGGN